MKLFALITLLAGLALGAQTEIPVQTVSDAGLTPGGSVGGTDETNGYSFKNANGDVMLLIENTGGTGSATVVVSVQKATVSVPGFGTLTKSDASIVVGTNSSVLIGPFAKQAYNLSDKAFGTISGTGAADIAISPFRFDPTVQ